MSEHDRDAGHASGCKMVGKFEEIDAWKRGRRLVKSIYALTNEGPFAYDLGLKEQIQRAAVSVCSNIAEGFGRRGNKEFVKFLWIAKGSAAEIQSQLYHARDLKYVQHDKAKELYSEVNLISAEIYSLIKTLSVNLTHVKV